MRVSSNLSIPYAWAVPENRWGLNEVRKDKRRRKKVDVGSACRGLVAIPGSVDLEI